MEHLSDVTLVASGGERFELHKVILASASAFFAKAFEDQPSSTEISISEPSDLLTAALSHVYDNREAQAVTLDIVCTLVSFFSKYDVPKGIAACDSFLAAWAGAHHAVLSTATLPGWIAFADRHKLASFLEKCAGYAAEHMAEFPEPEAWMVQLLPSTLALLVHHHMM